MIEEIGRYNVDYAGEAFDGKKLYKMIIISEFVNQKEISRKLFYFDFRPTFRSEEDIDSLMKLPSNSKVYQKITYDVK